MLRWVFLLVLVALVRSDFVAVTDPVTGAYLYSGQSGSVPVSMPRCGIDVAMSSRSAAVGCVNGVAVFQLQQSNGVGAVLQWENTQLLFETGAVLVSNVSLQNPAFFFASPTLQASFVNLLLRGAYGTVLASSELFLAVGCMSCAQASPADTSIAQGRVYIYSRLTPTGDWSPHSTLAPDVTGVDVFFGASLSFGDGNTLAVGALYPAVGGAVYIYQLSGGSFELAQNLTGYGGYAVDLKRLTLVIGAPQREDNYGAVTVLQGTPGTFAPVLGPMNVSRDATGMACGYAVAIDQPSDDSQPYAVLVGCPTVDATNGFSNVFSLRNVSTADWTLQGFTYPSQISSRNPSFRAFDLSANDGIAVVGIPVLDSNQPALPFTGGAMLLVRDATTATGYSLLLTDLGLVNNVPTVFGDVQLGSQPGCSWCVRPSFYNSTQQLYMGAAVAVSPATCRQVIVANPGRLPELRIGAVAFQDSEVDCSSVQVTGEDYVPPFSSKSSAATLSALF